ncbi:MAG: hypothetical protein HBSIN02_14010 [Bacteroidia bacterium]|nr:MAG: hypothetical protein HBSIN02_14010 [Bacteroidia bacterium]
MKRMSDMEAAVRTAVCTDCLYPSGMGVCGSGDWKDCPLNRFLPQALDAVLTGKSPSLVAYFQQFLSEMESRKGEASEAEQIPGEDMDWFSKFLPVIAEAVEELKAKNSSLRLRANVQ